MSAPHRQSPPLSQVLRAPRLALMLALGFSSGLPFLLIFSTQSVWLREAGVSRSAIGLMSYAALAFAFKFAWAPIIARFDPPAPSRPQADVAWMLIEHFQPRLCRSHRLSSILAHQ